MARFLDTSDSRGAADQGWLKSRHTFSFSSYHNPDRMGFGLLRVINDDIVEPSMGFGKHPHENMEIISIPLSGSLKHEDSMGHQHIISAGEIQIMSAGTGITHSEYNDSENENVNFLQIWVIPKITGVPPRYDQREININDSNNVFNLIVAPLGTEGVVNINQDVYFSMADLDAGATIEYTKTGKNTGVYFFIISGNVIIDETQLSARDGVGITEEDDIKVFAKIASRVLCMETPMI